MNFKFDEPIISFCNFQVTTLPNEFPEAHSIVNDLRLEYVIAVEGVVRPRPVDAINKKLKTGFIEVSLPINGASNSMLTFEWLIYVFDITSLFLLCDQVIVLDLISETYSVIFLHFLHLNCGEIAFFS